MDFAKEIFKRATVKGISDYLLYGSIPKVEDRDYEQRLNEPYLKYEKIVLQDKKKGADLLDLVNDMTSDTASVYMEIGVQSGILILNDIIQNVIEKNSLEQEIKPDFYAMYKLLFNNITSVLTILEKCKDERVVHACEILKDVQRRTEKIYVEIEEDIETKRF